MLVLTDRAATVIGEILEGANAGPEAGLRISGAAEESGEASLEFALAAAPIDGDEVVREGEATIFLDGLAATALDGKTLDAEAHDDHFHFSLSDGETAV